MNISAKSVLVIAFVAVVALFVLFSGGMLSGSMLSGGFMGGGMTLAPARSAGVGGGVTGGISWMLIPIALTLALGVLLGWAIWGKK